ncbi:hypothetical protein [Sulfitobacter sp.]|uniref:hypothetical protein n=1 Tax=Sulfitobacter sp. TaxID=1903071 RepID=UPI003EF163DB
MRNFINVFLDRFESRIALWLWLGSSGVLAIITAWLASASAWVNGFGIFAWVIIGLLTIILSLLALLVGVEVKHRLYKVYAIRLWSEKSEVINPLNDSFIKRRISFVDLADPLDGSIKGKTFRDCDLRGPCNLVMVGGGSISKVKFVNCDMVQLGVGYKSIFNVIKLEDCELIGGRVSEATIYVDTVFAETFREMGMILLTDKTGY